MTVTVYTAIRNATKLDFPIVEVLRHHLPLADEVVVLEGYSEDDTFELVSNIDPKVRVMREAWDRSDPSAWWRNFKQKAKSYCQGDWCIFIDADEFIPEWEFERLRTMMAETDKALIPIRLLNFYGNYKVLNIQPERIRWPVTKFVVHRNQPDIRFVGDGANVECDSCQWYEVPVDAITCHHFGAVRHPARLRQKWRNDGQMKKKRATFDWLPSFIFDIMPHDWFDADFMDDLAVYEGPYVKAVRENPARFVRDGMRLYEHMRKRGEIG